MGTVDVRGSSSRAAIEAGAIGDGFVIFTGNNFDPNGVTSMQGPQSKTAFEDAFGNITSEALLLLTSHF